MRKIKRKVAAKRRLSLLTFALSTLLPIYAATHDPDFQCAILHGATAQITIRVVDNEGIPVQGASIPLRTSSARAAAGNTN